MRQIVGGARLMGQGMYQPETGAVERHARQILAKGHLLAGLQIVPIVYRFRQPQVDQADGLEGVGVGQGMGANGDKGLDGVGQGIHAGGGGNGWRDVEHHAGVVDGDIRDQVRVDNHLFYLTLAIDNHGVAGHLRRRAGGGVDGHQRHASVFHFADAGVGGGGAWVGGEDFYRFGGINRAAAAEGDQVIAAGRLVRRIALLHQRFGGIRVHVVKQLISHLLFIQRGKQTVQQAQLHQLTVGDDQRLAPLFARYQLDHITDSACAVEADFR